ncbi:MAG TPA: class I SAM-dependent methyltransferase [Candidatus Acidoferrum sp.]|nr:class I SAM-dependent methyltransferase [Candidatus Acidoferrum sp.]
MNNANDSYALWKKEEQASFSGWDFSYIRSRFKEEKPSWDYIEEAKKLVKSATAVLDMGTGGGENFSKFGPFPKHAIATEGWPPNVPLARKKLEPLGVKIVAVDESEKLPFKNEEFDLVLNRHSGFDRKEIFRILQKDGIFFTQQVSGNNLQDLIEEFRRDTQFKEWNAEKERGRLEKIGFRVEIAEDWKGKEEFKDVGAIVYFLKAIPWTVKDFSVDAYLPTLKKLQKRVDSGEKLIFEEARFLIKARK